MDFGYLSLKPYEYKHLCMWFRRRVHLPIRILYHHVDDSAICVDSSQRTQRATYTPGTSAYCIILQPCNLYDVNRCKSIEFSLQSMGWLCSVTLKVCVQATAMSSTERLDLGMLNVECFNRKGLEASKERANSVIFLGQTWPNSLHQCAVYIFLTLIALSML